MNTPTTDQIAFGEVAEFKNGLNFSASDYGRGTKIIGVADFKDYTTPRYDELSEVSLDVASKKDMYLKNGDIVFVRSNGNKALVGRSMAIKNLTEKITFSGFVIRARPNPSLINIDFLAHFCKCDVFRQHVATAAGGANIQNLSQPLLARCPIPYPSLAVQAKIAGVLSAYDDLVEANARRIKLLEEMAQITYEEWFVRLRFPGHEATPVDPQTGLPEGWAEKENGDCCAVSGGGTPSTAIAAYWDDGDVPWFSPTDLSKANSLCLLDSEKKISDKGLKNSSAKLVGPETFMMTSRATIGLFGLIEKPYSTNQGFIVVTPQKPIHKHFLLFNFKGRVQEFYNHASGATFPEISKSKFKRLKVTWPSDDLIGKFSDFATPITQEMMNLTRQNALLKEARDLLLPRLMTGMVDIDDHLARHEAQATPEATAA